MKFLNYNFFFESWKPQKPLFWVSDFSYFTYFCVDKQWNQTNESNAIKRNSRDFFQINFFRIKEFVIKKMSKPQKLLFLSIEIYKLPLYKCLNVLRLLFLLNTRTMSLQFSHKGSCSFEIKIKNNSQPQKLLFWALKFINCHYTNIWMSQVYCYH